MTKLFSMKSAAFAGAAAFALALAAAPQADAAEASKLPTVEAVESPAFDGTLKLAVTAPDGEEFIETEDGEVIYYAVVKSGNAAPAEKKYVAIANENLYDEEEETPYYDFSKYAGKANDLYISLDGKAENATKVAITAAPKLKVKYSVKDGLEIKIGSATATDIVSGEAIETKYPDLSEGGYDAVVEAEGKRYVVDGIDSTAIKSASVLGATLEVKVREIDNPFAAPSKAAKLKIAAKPKAPKVSLKMNVTKEFKWKISNKQEYLVKVNGKKTAWADGSNSQDNWASILSKVENVKDIVSGDAITADVEISVRTKATDKKAASAITVLKLDKSVGSPTESAVKVEVTEATYKANGKVQKATGASIVAVKDIQYSVEAGKWKNLKANKTVKLKDTQKDVSVRIAGGTNVLPSLNSHISVDFQTGKATVMGVDYKDGAVAVNDKVEEYTAK